MLAICFWFAAALLIFFHYPKPKDIVELDGVINNGSESSRDSKKASRRQKSPRFADLASPEETDVEAKPGEGMSAGQDSRQESSRQDSALENGTLA
jgi:hypothetical protein